MIAQGLGDLTLECFLSNKELSLGAKRCMHVNIIVSALEKRGV